MRNINELFDNRDMIIESMGYFNPLIVGEYNNVVVTEGIIGGIVEKIKALGKMIKGWLQKLIDWVAGKFGRNNSYSTPVSSKPVKKSKSVQELEKIEEDIDKDLNEVGELSQKNEEIANKVEEIENKVTELNVVLYNEPTEEDIININKKEIEAEIRRAEEEIRRSIRILSDIPKKIRKNEKELVKLRRRIINYNTAKIKIPDLKKADDVVYQIISDCDAAIKSDTPCNTFALNKKSGKEYFVNSDTDKVITVKDFMESEVYKSYNEVLGSKTIDELRKYMGRVDATYKQLEIEAKNTTDETESTRLLNKANDINKLSQRFLKLLIDYLTLYSERIGNLRIQFSTDISNAQSRLNSVESKLKDLKDRGEDGYIAMATEMLYDAQQKIKESKDKLKELN